MCRRWQYYLEACGFANITRITIHLIFTMSMPEWKH